jgi:UDP-N-acetylglucosamine--N-acetylmuramyl-(pentapeptide) pyrophosphoryl-undecaprenol N-acetylglucosamine transferase
MEKYFPEEKIVMSGNPVREAIRNFETSCSTEKARATFGLDAASKVILVIGGSLGARSINRAVIEGLPRLAGSGVKMIWQCGRYYLDEANASLEGLPEGTVILKEFIVQMDMAYGAADLIVARAGAITISELCHIGKPAILIPSPNVAEDHQTRNAQSLVRHGAAVYIPDREASGMMSIALELLENEKKQEELSKRIKALAMPDSGGRIAEEIISLMKG